MMVWFDLSSVKFSSLLTLPIPNALPEDQGRSALSPNFKINGLSIAQDVILPGTTGKRARILCLKCNAVTFFPFWNYVLLYFHYMFWRLFLKVVTNQEHICNTYHWCVVMGNITSTSFLLFFFFFHDIQPYLLPWTWVSSYEQLMKLMVSLYCVICFCCT